MKTLEQVERQIEQQEMYEQLNVEADNKFKAFVKAVRNYLSSRGNEEKEAATTAQLEFVKAKCASYAAAVEAGVDIERLLDSAERDGRVNIGGYWFDAQPFYAACGAD